MAHHQSVVLEDISLQAFVQYVLDIHQGPSTLVVCGSKDAFIEQLAVTVPSPAEEDPGPSSQDSPARHPDESTKPAQSPWAVPTLRLLAISRTVKVAFCPDITHLRAYLATYNPPRTTNILPICGTSASDNKLLAILNPIELHRPTLAFSAQGLNRTISGAVEAAHRSNSRLIVAECTDRSESGTETERPDDTAEGATEHPAPSSLWDEEVSILNVTTKSFGAGERGWVGRTVKLRAITARWCMFQRV